LQGEIHLLGKLVEQAKTLVSSKQDRKWDELSKILQKEGPETRDRDGRLRKLIVFTEHKDTLNYLRQQIIGVLGSEDAVVVIHGGTHRDDRKKAQELFRSDLAVRVLLATDAAGEGVNLQTANLMVNYDLPWNPNRLEQRFGRIHRIGQMEVCHLWNLVAKETREGDVYHRLLKKLEVEGIALKGRVFDILGEVFEDISLKDLLMEAVRYGDSPETRERMWMQKADRLLEHENLLSVMNRNALAQEDASGESGLFEAQPAFGNGDQTPRPGAGHPGGEFPVRCGGGSGGERRVPSGLRHPGARGDSGGTGGDGGAELSGAGPFGALGAVAKRAGAGTAVQEPEDWRVFEGAEVHGRPFDWNSEDSQGDGGQRFSCTGIRV
jgi:superfamily II DNA/RNA helicase